MVLNDLFADCQADACAGVGCPGMQALKDVEDTFEVLGIDADAIVTHCEYSAPAWRLVVELEGVTELALLEVGLVLTELALVVRLGGNDNLAGLRTTTNRNKQW
jgi:hypothetical protein